MSISSDEQNSEFDGPDPPPLNVWDALAAADTADVEIDLLAAYAEGRLNDDERQAVRQAIAGSPRAIELFDSVRQHLRDEIAEPPSANLSLADARSQSHQRMAYRRLRPQWLVAAGLLFAVGLGAWLVQRERTISNLSGQLAVAHRDLVDQQTTFDQQLAGLNRAMADSHRRLAVARKERLATAADGRPFMIGATSPALARRALSQTSSRGIDDLSESERLDVDQALTDAVQAVQATDAGAVEQLIESASLDLSAGNLEEARRLANEAQAAAGRTPAVLNLQAAVLMTQALDEIPDQADRTFEAAAALLTEATQSDPAFAPAWFNLALLREQQGDRSAAAQAWDGYLSHESSAELRDLVRGLR